MTIGRTGMLVDSILNWVYRSACVLNSKHQMDQTWQNVKCTRPCHFTMDVTALSFRTHLRICTVSCRSSRNTVLSRPESFVFARCPHASTCHISDTPILVTIHSSPLTYVCARWILRHLLYALKKNIIAKQEERLGMTR